MTERTVKALGLLLLSAVILRIVVELITPLIPALLSLLITSLVLGWLVSTLFPPRGGKE